MDTITLPQEKINGQRFGQLIFNAIAGHMGYENGKKKITAVEEAEINEAVAGKLYYLENDELESIITDYLEAHKNGNK
jgi:hypothetical protein